MGKRTLKYDLNLNSEQINYLYYKEYEILTDVEREKLDKYKSGTDEMELKSLLYYETGINSITGITDNITGVCFYSNK